MFKFKTEAVYNGVTHKGRWALWDGRIMDRVRQDARTGNLQGV